VTTGHLGDFDARRIGWWQRRSTMRAISRAAGITQADRDLRLQSARVAQTRGELNVLTRGLSPAPQPVVPSSYAPPTPQQTAAQQPVRRTPRSIGKTVGLAIVVVAVTCGGTLVSCVSSLVDSASDISSGSPSTAPPVDLLTAGAWSQMVQDLDEEVGVDRVTEVAVRRTNASVVVPGAGSSDTSQMYYYDGDVSAAQTDAPGAGRTAFDLTGIDPVVVTDAVIDARSRSGAAPSSQAWVYIADLGDGPWIHVSFVDGTVGSYERVVDLAGTQVRETPAG
jgi:hypothetical protein